MNHTHQSQGISLTSATRIQGDQTAGTVKYFNDLLTFLCIPSQVVTSVQTQNTPDLLRRFTWVSTAEINHSVDISMTWFFFCKFSVNHYPTFWSPCWHLNFTFMSSMYGICARGLTYEFLFVSMITCIKFIRFLFFYLLILMLTLF